MKIPKNKNPAVDKTKRTLKLNPITDHCGSTTTKGDQAPKISAMEKKRAMEKKKGERNPRTRIMTGIYPGRRASEAEDCAGLYPPWIEPPGDMGLEEKVTGWGRPPPVAPHAAFLLSDVPRRSTKNRRRNRRSKKEERRKK